MSTKSGLCSVCVQLGVQKVYVIQSSRVSAIQGFLIYEVWLGLSELPVILWVSAVEGCP